MKRNKTPLIVFLTCIILCFYSVTAQTPIEVLANDNTTVSFFFPSPIKKVISPAVNYKFEYTEGAVIGLLKARKGTKSNLTVITEQGYIYSFILGFSEKVQNFNYILSAENAIGNTNGNIAVPEQEKDPVVAPVSASVGDVTDNEPKTTTTTIDTVDFIKDSSANSLEKEGGNTYAITQTGPSQTEEGDLYHEDREEYYRIYCENNYLQRTIFKRSFRQNKRIVVKLNNVLIDRNEIYLVMQLENNSKKEYSVNGLGFFLKNEELETQKIMTPLYTFNLQDVIDPESINEVVCVFNKFDLKSKEKISVVLDEKDGNRMVLLPLDDKQINAPTN